MRPLFGWTGVLAVTVSLMGCDQRPALSQDTVALVGGRPITQADLDRQLQRLPAAHRTRYAQPAHRHELLETMVGTELLALEAERLGFHRDPEYQQLVKQQLVNQLLRYTLDPLTSHEARDRRMRALLAEARTRFKVEILDPQLSLKFSASGMNTAAEPVRAAP